ncbi:MAG: hypothetical protein IKH02_02880 [Prevotella sp.]|nr:hypothetical protein [Prevotella sp.]MBR3087942.1 hypothetical protein [Prevotella sp.]
MKASEQTIQQIERLIKKIAQKFPEEEDPTRLTDIHLRVYQDSGEILAYDDDDEEITRCVVNDWIENKDADFYEHATNILRQVLKRHGKLVDKMGILKPFSFVLENDEKESIAELYIADDDTIIITGDLMDGLDKDLDSFFEKLMKE